MINWFYSCEILQILTISFKNICDKYTNSSLSKKITIRTFSKFCKCMLAQTVKAMKKSVGKCVKKLTHGKV